tara:strand:+ start:64 stop:288 length:225 start_codon:yes stop_codon:yes gene_type:complete
MPVNTKQSTYEELKKETGCGDRLLSSALRTMALEEIKKKNEKLKKENEELKKEIEDIMKNTSFVIKWDELLKGF